METAKSPETKIVWGDISVRKLWLGLTFPQKRILRNPPHLNLHHSSQPPTNSMPGSMFNPKPRI